MVVRCTTMLRPVESPEPPPVRRLLTPDALKGFTACMTVRLRGLCWDHPRCVRPMRAAAVAYLGIRPDVVVEWDARPLAQFNDQPVWEVGGYDLIFMDHPMVGAVAERAALVP